MGVNGRRRRPSFDKIYFLSHQERCGNVSFSNPALSNLSKVIVSPLAAVTFLKPTSIEGP